MNEPNTETIQSDRDALTSGTTEAELWLKKIQRAQDDEKAWRKDAQDAVEAYEADDDKAISFNIFHSNVETMIPALYNSSPMPDVRRRFSDADPIGKQVSDLSERAINYTIDQYDIDGEMIAMLRDGIVTGRGVLRLRYTPHIEGDNVGHQELTCERVPWDKFVRGPARAWHKMPWCAVEHDLTKDELMKLNPTLASKTSLGEKPDREKDSDQSKDPTGILKTTRIYEIWDKLKREVLFIDDQKQLWSKVPDPLNLAKFLPFLQPLQPVHRVTSMVPVCQYKVYKPLLDELDAITKRITKLIKQLKVRGLIDGEMAPDFETLKSCEDGQYIAASNAAMFASQGGLEKAIAHWPLDPTVKALAQLYVQRDSIKQTIYEVTGISDIMRGATDPHETLGAQEIKKQMGSLRIQRLQGEVARVAKELFRAKVEIFATHYTDENLQIMTGMPVKEAAPPQPQQPPQQMSQQPGQPPQGPPGMPGQMSQMPPQQSESEQQWPQVLQVFRSEMRSYRIDIETDSTIRADMSRNQDQMNSFLTGTGTFATAMAEIIQLPQIGQAAMPVMVEVYTAFARKFKLGKQAEDALDKLSTSVQQASQQPQEDKPDPEVEKAKVQMQVLQQKADLDAKAMQAKAQMDGQAMQGKMASDERMAQIAEQKAQVEIQVKQMELEIKREELQMKREAAAIDARARQETLASDRQSRQMDMEFMGQEHAMKRDVLANDRQHAMQSNAIEIEGMADKAKFAKKQMQERPRPSP